MAIVVLVLLHTQPVIGSLSVNVVPAQATVVPVIAGNVPGDGSTNIVVVTVLGHPDTVYVYDTGISPEPPVAKDAP